MFEHSYNQTTNFLHKVYAWMGAGLVLTAGVAAYIAGSPDILKFIFTNKGVVIGLMIAQVALVMGLSFGINKMGYAPAALLFLAYSVLNGVTLSSVFIVYTHTSVAYTFLVTAAMFLTMAVYGYFTRADLSSMGSFLFMALIGLIIAGILNTFFHNGVFELLIAGAGVIIFTLLTAYDVQKLKMLSYQLQGEDASKIAVLGALTLYLDFVNLFIYMLRFMGQKRDK